MPALESVLPRLAYYYSKGLLVPFLGAGMSAEGCPLWGRLVLNLEAEASIVSAPIQNDRDSNELIQRAARAVRSLKNRSPEHLAQHVQNALRLEDANVTPSAEELAKIWWPLIITTNYDDWFYTSWNLKHTLYPEDGTRRPLADLLKLQVCGRNRPDCERVLNSLRAPDSPILWAIQGFVGGQASKVFPQANFPVGNVDQLAEELVVGHEEYRRVTHGALSFRRTFAEVFRSRSFLFLGTSLAEPYFLNLFDEILELQGPLDHVHYAFVKRGSVNTELLRDRLQIISIEYSDHDDLPGLIASLGREIRDTQPMKTTWSYSLQTPSPLPPGGNTADLQIVRGGLPKASPEECLAISAGINGKDLLLSRVGEECLRDHLGLGTEDLRPKLKQVDEHIWRLTGHPAFIVVAREMDQHSDYRDARVIRQATSELLKCAEKAGFEMIHSMLLAAGRHRKFPPYVSLIQMAKGFASYRTRNLDHPTNLSIYVVDPGVLSLLATGRVDLGEVLFTEDTRFWVEILRSRQDVTRAIEFARADTPLSEILARYDIPAQGWRAEVIPSPIEHQKILDTEDIFQPSPEPWTVAGIGLLPGSTLRLFRDNFRP